MRVLIDGHNALFALRIKAKTHEQQRHGLLRLVGAVAPRATVYFDARDARDAPGGHASELGVRVVYCRDADAAILDAVREADQPAGLLVVTNDREVSGRAAQLGAKRAGIREFFGAPEEPEEERELPGLPRMRFEPKDFGLPDYVDLEDPEFDGD